MDFYDEPTIRHDLLFTHRDPNMTNRLPIDRRTALKFTAATLAAAVSMLFGSIAYQKFSEVSALVCLLHMKSL